VGGRRRRSTPGYSRGAARVLECTAAAAARPRAARAVLSCAGAYLSGAAGSNECPAGSVRIEAEAACRTAVTAAGKTAASRFVETDPYYPRGCYYGTTYAYFNIDAVGAGSSSAQLLCIACDGCTITPTGTRPCHESACAHDGVCVR
jgi:hypothetical protein